MFGVTMVQLKLKNAYTAQEFYDKISGASFEAGVPQLVKYGPAYVIAFPQLDRNNQIWVQADRKGRITVTRSTQVIGLDKMVSNMLLDNLTGGLSSLSGMTGKNKKRCNELVEITAREMEALGL